MAISYIQGQFGLNFGAAATSISATLGSAVGSGHMLCVFVYWGAAVTGDTVAITDDKSNTYSTLDVNVQNGNLACATGYLLNITNGPSTITATFKNGGVTVSRQFLYVTADEFSGIASLDVHNIQYQAGIAAGSNTVTSPSVTPTANGELVYGATGPNGPAATSIAAGTGFTGTLSPIGAGYVTNEYLVQATAAAVTATFSPAGGSADNYITGVMTFKPTATPWFPPSRRGAIYLTKRVWV